jgi:hypothetical protein
MSNFQDFQDPIDTQIFTIWQQLDPLLKRDLEQHNGRLQPDTAELARQLRDTLAKQIDISMQVIQQNPELLKMFHVSRQIEEVFKKSDL